MSQDFLLLRQTHTKKRDYKRKYLEYFLLLLEFLVCSSKWVQNDWMELNWRKFLGRETLGLLVSYVMSLVIIGDRSLALNGYKGEGRKGEEEEGRSEEERKRTLWREGGGRRGHGRKEREGESKFVTTGLWLRGNWSTLRIEIKLPWFKPLKKYFKDYQKCDETLQHTPSSSIESKDCNLLSPWCHYYYDLLVVSTRLLKYDRFIPQNY